MHVGRSNSICSDGFSVLCSLQNAFQNTTLGYEAEWGAPRSEVPLLAAQTYFWHLAGPVWRFPQTDKDMLYVVFIVDARPQEVLSTEADQFTHIVF